MTTWFPNWIHKFERDLQKLIFPVTLNWEWNLRILGNTRKVTRILIFPVTLNWKWLKWAIWVILEKWLGFWFSQSLWTGSDSNWEFWVILEKWLGFSIFVKLAPLDWNDFYSHEFTLLTCLGVCRMNLNGTYKNWISQSLWTRVKIL